MPEQPARPSELDSTEPRSDATAAADGNSDPIDDSASPNSPAPEQETAFDVPSETTSEPLSEAISEVGEDPRLTAASQPFVGRWNHLISTTNWEKGRIIHEWREAMIAAEAPTTEYSDEAWSQRVGGVTGQHVGRLRRVYHRFGETYEQYPRLYWSHFQAALEWNDAEMWLEGAVQSKWSVSQMRKQRWEAIGAPADKRPRDEDIISTEIDEDYSSKAEHNAPDNSSSTEVPPGPRHEGPDFGDEDQSGGTNGSTTEAVDQKRDSAENVEPVEYIKPFENLADLPDDLAEAFEMFKLAILRHKGDDWRDIARDDVVASLDALKQLAFAPKA